MTHVGTKTDRLLDELRQLDTPPDSSSRAAARRRRVVRRLEDVLAEDETRRRLARRWGVYAAVALAACIVVSVGGGWLARGGLDSTETGAPATASALAMSGQVQIVRDGMASPLSRTEHEALRLHDVIKTGSDSGAQLSTASGAAVRLSASTELSLVPGSDDASSGDERIRLMQGRVDVEVPKRAPGRTFSVATPDALVVVHGTRFTVQVEEAKPGKVPLTSVRVTRGKVEVRNAQGAILLEAGGTWRSRARERSDGAPPRPESSAHAGADTTATGDSSTSEQERTGGDAEPTQPTSLTEENRIYQAAMRAKQSGQDEVMVQQLDRLLLRYPKSPLAPDARVARFRALQRLGRTEEAARSARRYLAEHPEGFASQEARDVALGVTPAPSSEHE